MPMTNISISQYRTLIKISTGLASDASLLPYKWRNVELLTQLFTALPENHKEQGCAKEGQLLKKHHKLLKRWLASICEKTVHMSN